MRGFDSGTSSHDQTFSRLLGRLRPSRRCCRRSPPAPRCKSEVFDNGLLIDNVPVKMTGAVTLTASDANFANITVNVQGSPILPKADLSSVTFDATTSSSFSGTHTLTVDALQSSITGTGNTLSTFTVKSCPVNDPGPTTESSLRRWRCCSPRDHAPVALLDGSFGPVSAATGAFTSDGDSIRHQLHGGESVVRRLGPVDDRRSRALDLGDDAARFCGPRLPRLSQDTQRQRFGVSKRATTPGSTRTPARRSRRRSQPADLPARGRVWRAALARSVSTQLFARQRWQASASVERHLPPPPNPTPKMTRGRRGGSTARTLLFDPDLPQAQAQGAGTQAKYWRLSCAVIVPAAMARASISSM